MKINISRHMQKKYSQFFQIVEEDINILYSYDEGNRVTCHSKLNNLNTYTYSDYSKEKTTYFYNLFTVLSYNKLAVWKKHKQTFKFIDLDKQRLIGVKLFRLVRNFSLIKKRFAEVQMELRVPDLSEKRKNKLLDEHKECVIKLERQRSHIKYIFRRDSLLLEYILYLLNIGICEEDLFRPYR